MLSCLVLALLAQAPVATTPGAPAAAAEDTVSGNVSLGLIRLTGNSETTTFAFGSGVQRKTATWIYGVKLTAAYGTSTDATTGVEHTDALNGAFAARVDRRLNPALAIYLEGAVDTDHLKSIEARPTGEAGVSFQLIDRKNGEFQTESLRVDFGFRAGREYRFQYFPTPVDLPDQTIAAPKAGFALRYAFSEGTIFSDELTSYVNIPDGPRLVLANVAKLTARVYQRLTFGVSYGIVEDSSPPPLKKQLDTTLTVAFEATF